MGHGREREAYIKLRNRLLSLGFERIRQNGSHVKYKHPMGYSIIITPELNTIVFKRLMKELDVIENKIQTVGEN